MKMLITPRPLLGALLLLFPLLLAAQSGVLQPLSDRPGSCAEIKCPFGEFYVPATLETIRWGFLPNGQSQAVLTVPSGALVTFDTVSHEGILEDQGRDPVRYFGQFGIPASDVLNDAKRIASSTLDHDFVHDGPHIIVGPVAIEGAQPGDVLKVEMVSLLPRMPYGVITNRHGKGALPGEFPETPDPEAGASAANSQLFHNISKLGRLRMEGGKLYGFLQGEHGREVRFPIAPFMGTMGVAPATGERPNSIPPGAYGGNLDIRYLTAGATLYLPVQVAGGMFFMSDPHFAQGNGEVALTALEGSLRTTVRLRLLKAGDPEIPAAGRLSTPFAETNEYWIPIGLDPDLNEAMKKATRESIRFLSEKLGVDRATAMAYASAAIDFEVSQVVDRTKGIHALIRKADWSNHRGSE